MAGPGLELGGGCTNASLKWRPGGQLPGCPLESQMFIKKPLNLTMLLYMQALVNLRIGLRYSHLGKLHQKFIQYSLGPWFKEVVRGGISFLADRTNGRAYATALRPSLCLSSVCNVMYCG